MGVFSICGALFLFRFLGLDFQALHQVTPSLMSWTRRVQIRDSRTQDRMDLAVGKGVPIHNPSKPSPNEMLSHIRSDVLGVVLAYCSMCRFLLFFAYNRTLFFNNIFSQIMEYNGSCVFLEPVIGQWSQP